MTKCKSELESTMLLCAAIIGSGIRCNDLVFLSSPWCRFLKDNLQDYLRNNDKKYTTILNNLED